VFGTRLNHIPLTGVARRKVISVSVCAACGVFVHVLQHDASSYRLCHAYEETHLLSYYARVMWTEVVLLLHGDDCETV